MDKHKRAYTKERNRVRQIRKDVFEKLEQILKDKVRYALGLPIRVLVDNSYRDFLDKQQERARTEHRSTHSRRDRRRTAHKSGSQIYAAEIKYKTDKTVLTEYCLAYMLSLDTSVYVHNYCDNHKSYAYGYGKQQYRIDTVHNRQRLSAPTELFVNRIERFLKAEHAAEDKSEYH